MTNPIQQAAEAICRILPSRGLYKKEIAQIISTALAQSMPEAGEVAEPLLRDLYGLREELDLQYVVEYDDGDEALGDIMERVITEAHHIKTTHAATVARLEEAEKVLQKYTKH